MSPIIKIKNITKNYASKVANSDLTFDIFPQQITAIVGHNGAGKTTLLNQINGLLKINQGMITVDNIDVQKYPGRVRQLISSMPQFQAPLKGVTMQEAVSCIGLIRGLSPKVVSERCDEIFKYLDIEDWKHEKGDTLSGGLQRLTSFAMTVVDRAPVIVLDEPTNDVDPIRRKLMWEYLRKLANEGSAIIIVSHNLLEVERYADRYILLNKGKLMLDMSLSGKQIDIQHTLRVFGILPQDKNRLANFGEAKYKSQENLLSLSLKNEHIFAALHVVLRLLDENKAVAYELQTKSLLDEYEEVLNECI